MDAVVTGQRLGSAPFEHRAIALGDPPAAHGLKRKRYFSVVATGGRRRVERRVMGHEELESLSRRCNIQPDEPCDDPVGIGPGFDAIRPPIDGSFRLRQFDEARFHLHPPSTDPAAFSNDRAGGTIPANSPGFSRVAWQRAFAPLQAPA